MNSSFRVFVLALTVSFIAATASATNYYIAASGSDSSNGTSKTTPWQHAPGMKNCTGTCAATTPKAGDQLIFRGGDTWHFGNSGASPYAGGTWVWSWAGSSASPIYVGVDETWYSGSSWARPILTGDNPLSSSFVSSCTYDNYAALTAGSVFETAGGVSYVTFDNFDLQGRCWAGSNGSDGGMIYLANTPSYFIFSNNYCHGWTTVDTTFDGYVCVLGSGASNPDHNQFVGNVFDGSDSSQAPAGSAHCKWSGTWGTAIGCQSGGMIYQAAYDMHDNVFRYSSNIAVTTNSVTIHDNLFEYLYPSYQNSGPHPNIVNEDANVEGVNSSFNNNIVRHAFVSETFFLTVAHGQTLYFFNNVFFDLLHWGPGDTAAQNCLLMESTQNESSTAYFYNNTFDWGTGGCKVTGAATNLSPYSTNWSGTMYFENNHFIGYDASHSSPTIANAVTGCVSGSCTFTDNGSEVFQTESAANGQGYTSSNNYAPTTTSGATVGVAANVSSSCPTFSSNNALCSGTSDGALEQGGDGGEIANAPAIPMVARQSAWDVGAYQFGSGTQPNPPTGLAAIVQ